MIHHGQHGAAGQPTTTVSANSLNSLKHAPDMDVLTTAEAAELLRVSEPTMRKLAPQLGRRVGKDWRYSRAALVRWLEAPAIEAEDRRRDHHEPHRQALPPPADTTEVLAKYLAEPRRRRARGRPRLRRVK
jgi:excisionase family DNA binding protein